MRLIPSPVRLDLRLTVEVKGEVLVLNGEEFDFGPLARGAYLPREAIDSPWFAGPVSRDIDGVLAVPLVLPHGSNAPKETLFPVDILVKDGQVALPPYQIEETADAED